MKYTAFTSKCV